MRLLPGRRVPSQIAIRPLWCRSPDPPAPGDVHHLEDSHGRVGQSSQTLAAVAFLSNANEVPNGCFKNETRLSGTCFTFETPSRIASTRYQVHARSTGGVNTSIRGTQSTGLSLREPTDQWIRDQRVRPEAPSQGTSHPVGAALVGQPRGTPRMYRTTAPLLETASST